MPWYPSHSGAGKMSNTNAMNLCTEHLLNPRLAKERYGGTPLYEETLAKIEEALNAKVEQQVTSGKLYFAGFPSNMGKVARLNEPYLSPGSWWRCRPAAPNGPTPNAS